MNIKKVIDNLKNKGIKKTYELHKESAYKRKYARYFQKFTKKIDYSSKLYIERPFEKFKNNAAKYNAFMKVLFEKEEYLRRLNHEQYSKYLNEMKAIYIKERIPRIYSEEARKPVEKKVIFMENGNSPSPSSFHISKKMQQEREYTVHLTGLGIRQVSYIEYYERALEFIKDLATSKAVFLSTANDLLSHFDVRKETKVIQLWHGVGVLKKVGYSTMSNKHFGKNKAEREEYNQYRNYSYVTIAAPEQSWIFEEAMNIDKDSGIIVPIGVSRTDVFFDKDYIQSTYSKLYKALPQIEGKKIILYAPTFRGAVANAKAPNQLDIDAFGKALSDEYVLLIKHHGLSKDVPEIPEKWKNNFAYDIGKSKILGIERLLAIADICITDYSSIAFEYAIMEKPLIFYAYDLEDYIDKRGMYYDYDEITPGPVCKTNEEMIDFIVNIDSRFDKQQIIDFKNKHVGACDGHATDRTLELLEK